MSIPLSLKAGLIVGWDEDDDEESIMFVRLILLGVEHVTERTVAYWVDTNRDISRR